MRGRDATDWDEDGYRRTILQERELQSRTAFRTAFAPCQNPKPDILVVASSDGSIAFYSISSLISSHPLQLNKARYQQLLPDFSVAEPLRLLQGHSGPAYDVKFYGNGDDSVLLSCGDDGRILGWKLKEILDLEVSMPLQGNNLNPVLNLMNPQHKGPWGALSPVPENNAIAVDTQGLSIFSAAGDTCAYCWDVIITGSEDGTARIWDCRSGKCIQVIYPENDSKLKGVSSWVGCVAIDTSESWLACGTGKSLSVWNLPSSECILRLETHSPTQDVLFDDNHILAVGAEPFLRRFNINGTVLSQIQCAPPSAFSIALHPSGVTAVGGYGGLVDVISDFGSHLCTFRCQGVCNDYLQSLI